MSLHEIFHMTYGKQSYLWIWAFSYLFLKQSGYGLCIALPLMLPVSTAHVCW